MKFELLMRRKKALITSFFIVFLMMTISVISPATHDKNVCKLLENKDMEQSKESIEEMFYDEIFNKDFENFHDLYHDLFSSLKTYSKAQNNFILTSLIDLLLNTFDNNHQYFDSIDNFPLIFDAVKKYYADSTLSLPMLFKKSISLRDDVSSFTMGINKNFDPITQDDLLDMVSSQKSYEVFFDLLQSSDELTSMDIDLTDNGESNFSIYANRYNDAKTWWSKSRIFGGSDSIDDWYLKMTNWMFGIEYDDSGTRYENWYNAPFFWVNGILGSITATTVIIAIFNGEFSWMAFGTLLMFFWGIFNLMQLWKVMVGFNRATNLMQNQISFNIRIIDENGSGIDNLESYYIDRERDATNHERLEGYIKISNLDASGSPYKEDFEYYLGPAFGKNEPGWYSVSSWNPSSYESARKIEGEIGYNWKYFRSPPAPGRYSIELLNSTGGDFIVDGVKYLTKYTETNEIGFFGDYSNTLKIYWDEN